MTVPDKCQCDGPGFCPLLKRECDPPMGRMMGNARHNECKNKPHYFEMFLGEVNKPCSGKGGRVPPPNRGMCVHRGEVLRKQKGELCGCRDPQEVYACALHGECTTKRAMRRMSACNTCIDHVPVDFRRNLIMHVYPVEENGGWQANADVIRKHRDLFDGKRIIAIATNSRGTRHRLDPPEVVRERFGEGFEFLEIPNDRKLREVATFIPLMERVESIQSDDATFYCHSKGCTHDTNDGTTVWRWRDLMYEICLDWEYVRQALGTHSVCGAFKRYSPLGKSDWHFSGTFFWFRNKDAFSRNWRNIDVQWSGVESWPGKMFHIPEAKCLFCDNAGDLYKMDEWETRVVPELEQWREARPTATS